MVRDAVVLPSADADGDAVAPVAVSSSELE
jgi:hypothetical protein